jgi:ankyrin repeat protein
MDASYRLYNDCIRSSDYQSFRRLAKSDKNLDPSILIRLAIKHNNLRVLKYLSRHNNSLAGHSTEAFLQSIKRGHYPITKFLIQQRLVTPGDNNNIGLKLAIRHGKLDILKYLVKHGGDLGVLEDQTDDTVIEATKNNHLQVLR